MSIKYYLLTFSMADILDYVPKSIRENLTLAEQEELADSLQSSQLVHEILAEHLLAFIEGEES